MVTTTSMEPSTTGITSPVHGTATVGTTLSSPLSASKKPRQLGAAGHALDRDLLALVQHHQVEHPPVTSANSAPSPESSTGPSQSRCSVPLSGRRRHRHRTTLVRLDGLSAAVVVEAADEHLDVRRPHVVPLAIAFKADSLPPAPDPSPYVARQLSCTRAAIRRSRSLNAGPLTSRSSPRSTGTIAAMCPGAPWEAPPAMTTTRSAR